MVWTVFSFICDLTSPVWEIWSPLLSGGSLVITPAETTMSPEQLYALLAQQRVTVLNLTPSVLSALLHYRQTTASDLPRLTLRHMHCGGEALPWDVAQAALDFGQPLWNFYGPTESTVWASVDRVQISDVDSGRITVGRPFAGRQMYILDGLLNPTPVGVPGILYIGGEGLARGYLGHPEWTAEKFIPHPFSIEPGARLYNTGDLCRHLPDGRIEFVGRVDHQVKIRGFRIELGEIESALLALAGVREAVVLAREDIPGDRRLVAYIGSAESAVSANTLREHLLDKLPGYMVPSAFVILESLPLTPNGKVDRKALPAPDADGVQEDTYIAPRNPIEEGLAEIWGAVLKLGQIGVHNNFFELGGHSLLATQVISRIRSTFQVELPLRALFEAPNIAGLAERIEAAFGEDSTAVPPLVKASREQPLPLSFAQQRLWFLDQFEPGGSLYNIPMALRLKGSLNTDALQQSLGEMVLRHESLRTSFTLVDGEPVQVIRKTSEYSLEVVDLSGLEDGDCKQEAQRLVQEEAQRPFDLQQGPLFRAGLLRLSDDEHILLLTLHHIISDGWSQGVLRRELPALYNAFSQGKPCSLPELPIQYADYAAWQRNWLQGEALERQIDYWKRNLGGAPALLELPTDRPRPPAQTFRGALKRHPLPESLSQSLKQLGQREGATLFMTLLAAFQVLLSRYSGQNDIVVGTPIANRTQAETEGVIGFFTNTLALRGDLSGDPTFRELLSRVRAMAIGAYTHQDLPFEKLVEELQPERSMSHSPVFQVMFTLQSAAGGAMEFEGLQLAGAGGEAVTAKFDLNMWFSEIGSETLAEHSSTNTDLFDADRIERMLGHFQTMLEGIVADPDQRISHLPMVTADERSQLLIEWNDTCNAFPDLRLHQLVEAQVDRSPDATAVRFEEISISYRELDVRSNQLAHYLRSHGICAGTYVGIEMERVCRACCCSLRCPQSGCGIPAYRSRLSS